VLQGRALFQRRGLRDLEIENEKTKIAAQLLGMNTLVGNPLLSDEEKLI
jgi:hypothetical protein